MTLNVIRGLANQVYLCENEQCGNYFVSRTIDGCDTIILHCDSYVDLGKDIRKKYFIYKNCGKLYVLDLKTFKIIDDQKYVLEVIL